MSVVLGCFRQAFQTLKLPVFLLLLQCFARQRSIRRRGAVPCLQNMIEREQKGIYNLHMHRLTALFWGFVALLLGASVFFGVGASVERREIQGRDGKIENGAIVRLLRVVDGDTVLVVQEGQKPAHVRILGIKSFDAKIEKDAASPYGRAAFEALQRALADKPVRVMLKDGARDRFGRYIAILYADDHDVGLGMIEEGLVIAYTVYPFPAMTIYLQAQEKARSEKRGLWANSEAAQRAAAFIKEWQRQGR